MPFRTRRLRQALRWLVAAFQPKVLVTGWDPEVGPPLWQELLYVFTAPDGEIIGLEPSDSDAKPPRLAITWVTVRPPAAQRAQIQAALAAIQADDAEALAARAMRERYWLASSYFRLLSREAQN